MFVASNNVAVALIPKAGHSSIRQALGATGKNIDNEAAKKVETRVAFIRNPMTRLQSAYSFFYWLHEYETTHSGPPKDICSEWPLFVDYIFDVEDLHWTPQTEIVDGVPNIYHRFEEIQDHWPKYFEGFLPNVNGTTHRPINEYRMNDLMDRYQEDLQLWHSL